MLLSVVNTLYRRDYRGSLRVISVDVGLCISVFPSVYKKNPILMFCFNQNF